MTGADLLQSPALFAVALAVVAVAALAHGITGLGFPIITTPLLAMLTDFKTAVIISVFPNIAVNLVSVAKGGNWRASLGRHWPVAAFVLLGSIAGTRLLIYADTNLLKLLLAAMILVSVNQEALKRLDWGWLTRHPRLSDAGVGLTAGVLSGTVNVTVPPLVIYFMVLGLSPVAMTQVMNLCFLVGKGTQAATLALAGEIGRAAVVSSLPLTGAALAALFVGLRIQQSISRAAYQRMLRRILLAMALLLLWQVAAYYVRM